MKRVIFIFVFFIFVFIPKCFSANNGNITFKNISINEGLPHTIVSDIYQDKKGFMWFATGNGLCKYDGYNFTIFQNELGNQQSIPENIIVYIVPDQRDSLLWLMGTNNIVCFNIETEIFRTYPFHKKNTYSNILTDRNNYLWLITGKGLEKYDKTSQEARLCEKIKSDFEIVSFFEDSYGVLWLGSISGLYYLDADSRQIKKLITQSSFLNSNILSFFEDKNNTLWIGTSKGLVEFNNLNNSFAEYSYNKADEFDIGNSDVKTITEDYNHKLWIGTSVNGLYIFDKNTGKFISHYEHGDDNSISNNSILKLYKDAFDNIWIGTINGGLNKVSLNEKPFQIYSVSENKEVVTSLFEDSQENIWVGTADNGLYMFDKEVCVKKHYVYSSENKNSIGGGVVGAVTEDEHNNIWFITWSGSLNKININSGKIEVFKGGGLTLNAWAFRTILTSKKGLYLGSIDSGLELFNPVSEKSELIKSSVFSKGISSFYKENDTSLWIGERGSFSKYNLIDGSITDFSNVLNNNTDNMVMSFLKDSDSTIWIGTEGNGLIKLNEISGENKTYTKLDGLPDNSIYSIYKDKNENLWMSTNNGISKFNTKSLCFTNYTLSDGINSNEFKWGSHFQCKNGDIMFGGINGFTKFIPNRIKSNPFSPKVVITSFKLFNKTVNVGDSVNKRIILNENITYTDTLILKWNENDFTFVFASLHFANSNEDMYKYMLEGYDKTFINTMANNRNAHYTNLSPGEYIFKVWASNSDGVWSEKCSSVHVIIYPPWWRTLWFRIILSLIILISLYSVYKIRISSIKQSNKELEAKVIERTKEITSQKEELKKLNATKDKFFSIIAHDLKNPFQAISGFSYLLKANFNDIPDAEKIEYVEMINQSSNNASNLLDNLLQWANTQTNGIKFNPIPFDIHDVINSCIVLLQINAKNKSITIVDETHIASTVFADKNMITTVIRNVLNNAIKYTNLGGKITISQQNNQEGLSISISDNGVGMSKEIIENIFKIDKSISTVGTSGESGTGIGLVLCKEFLDKNNGKMDIESQIGDGSLFIIYLPTSPNSLLYEQTLSKVKI